MAIGQASDLSFLGDDSPIAEDRGLIVVNEETLETGMRGVYAGGDAVTVPELDPNARRGGFQEVALGYEADQAVRKANRCLQCDLWLFINAVPAPPEKVMAFVEKNVSQAPQEEGVCRLYDQERNLITIKGTPNLRRDLLGELEDNERAAFFDFEEDKMYSKRESELIQQYLQEHGEMPGGGDDDLNDLF
ncbi:MAG: hypothetical protein JRK53_01325 [Deltaproteobacteria bacterium]|nr:hypothetical protein [Deltaproteobacteria bacterium]